MAAFSQLEKDGACRVSIHFLTVTRRQSILGNMPNSVKSSPSGKLLCLLILNAVIHTSLGGDLKIGNFNNSSLSVTNSFPQGVVTMLNAPALTGPWTPLK